MCASVCARVTFGDQHLRVGAEKTTKLDQLQSTLFIQMDYAGCMCLPNELAQQFKYPLFGFQSEDVLHCNFVHTIINTKDLLSIVQVLKMKTKYRI